MDCMLAGTTTDAQSQASQWRYASALLANAESSVQVD